MKNKLYIRFDFDSEVDSIPTDLIFNNVKDAEDYFESTGKLSHITIEPENNHFSFKFNGTWSGRGECLWVKSVE